MAYTALYRKHRPRVFGGVVGQEHIVRTLKNQLVSGRVSHAYLFCGTRGTGKTSTAKIFAKAVNCENTVDGEACGHCRCCEAIDSGRSMNIIEIDAASNNSVDNIREIREEVRYPPAEGRYKIYIVDEVHMLSSGAFNALLKTLEEPPEHVVFILATTDPQKIPATIHSRCQRFDFRRIAPGEIAGVLGGYMAAEGVNVSADALAYIARVSDGAMRDALSILDQCITFYYGRDISLEDVLDIVGSVDDRVFFRLTDALLEMDGSGCMEVIDEVCSRGRDVSRFVSEFVTHLRNLLVARSVGRGSAALDLGAEAIERLETQAARASGESILRYISVFSELQGQLRYAASERILLEVCCLRACAPESEAPEDSGEVMELRLRKLESGFYGIKSAMAAGAVVKEAEPVVKPEPRLKKSVPEDIERVCKDWDGFAGGVGYAPLRAYLVKATPAYLEGDALMLVSTSSSAAESMRKYEKEIREALAERFEREFELRFVSREEYDERHRRVYGVAEDTFSREIFTEVINGDIMVED